MDPVDSNPQSVKTVIETVDEQFIDNLKECTELFAKEKIDFYDEP